MTLPQIEAKVELRDTFLRLSSDEISAKLSHDPIFLDINKEFNRYLETYGVRCTEEMKLESTPIKDNPVFCISMIQNYLRNRQQERNQDTRAKAEAVLKKRLKGKRIFFLLPKLWIYKWVLRNTRRAIKNRENQRFARAEAYSLTRTIFRAIGENWEKKGIIEKTDDIFYLEVDELWSFVEGTSTCVNLKGLIKLRKEEFEAYRSADLKDHIETYGEVYYQNCFIKEKNVVEGGNILRGTGCCGGTVEGNIKVVTHPDPTLTLCGEIMVAKQTDPGWVLLFPSVSGLIVEKGSMLSHSAIVAREMGIPAVVGVKNASEILRTGDKIRLNGSEGTIEILQRARR